jgi:hypothetical protein
MITTRVVITMMIIIVLTFMFFIILIIACGYAGAIQETGQAGWARLTSLGITASDLPQLAPDTLEALRPLTCLTEINISGAESSAKDYVSFLRTLTNLVSLNISNTTIQPADLAHMTVCTTTSSLCPVSCSVLACGCLLYLREGVNKTTSDMHVGKYAPFGVEWGACISWLSPTVLLVFVG